MYSRITTQCDNQILAVGVRGGVRFLVFGGSALSFWRGAGLSLFKWADGWGAGSGGFSRARGGKGMRRVEEVWCDSDLLVRFIVLVGGGALLGHGGSLAVSRDAFLGPLLLACTGLLC